MPFKRLSRVLIALASLALPSVTWAQDPCSVLALRLKARPKAVEGLGVWVAGHHAGGRDPNAHIQRLEELFGDALEDTLESMHYIRNARNIDHFVFEMDQSADKAAAALGTLRYLRQHEPDGAAGSILEYGVGTRFLDLRLPDGTGREFKILDWTLYTSSSVRLEFNKIRPQIADLVAGMEPNKRLGIVFDRPMPASFQEQLSESFGPELLASLDILYLAP
jgi:hypothetical protein